MSYLEFKYIDAYGRIIGTSGITVQSDIRQSGMLRQLANAISNAPIGFNPRTKYVRCYLDGRKTISIELF